MICKNAENMEHLGHWFLLEISYSRTPTLDKAIMIINNQCLITKLGRTL